MLAAGDCLTSSSAQTAASAHTTWPAACLNKYNRTDVSVTIVTCVLRMRSACMRAGQPRPSSSVYHTKRMAACSGKRLVGKVILITGAAQGIGRASAVVSEYIKLNANTLLAHNVTCMCRHVCVRELMW